jgi:hypothetical protein
MKWAASVSALAAAGRPSLLAAGSGGSLRPGLLLTQKELWDQQLWMAQLGPKYTGNKAHTTFVKIDAMPTAQLKGA